MTECIDENTDNDMKKLKIVIITGAFPTLSETFILNPIIRLIDLGHDVRILPTSSQRPCEVHSDVVSYNLGSITQYPTTLPKSKWKRRIKALLVWTITAVQHPIQSIRILKANLFCESGFSYRRFFFSIHLFQKPFDLVHCHFGPNASDAVDLKKAGLDFPLLTSFHGYDINSYPLKQGADCYKDLFSEGELFTANTNYTKQRVIEHGCDPSMIRIVHESLCCDKFDTLISEPSDTEEVKILTVGRMVEKKGYEYSLKAIAKVIENGHQVEYWAVGNGPLLGKIKDLAVQLNIHKRIKFLGALIESDVLNMYRKADIFILPSVTASDGDKEGQGLVLQEAQMTGLPVISTLHNGIPEGVKDGQSGFLVPEKDIDALVEKIEYLITNKKLWNQLGRTGKQFVRKTFDVSVVVEKLISVYQEIDSGQT